LNTTERVEADESPGGSRLRVKTVQILPDAVVLIDQLALPAQERYVRCATWQEVAERISDMTVRGAPAIGVTAAGGLALAAAEAARRHPADFAAFRSLLEEAACGLGDTRPTAVNLMWAIDQMRAVWRACAAGPAQPDPAACARHLLARAQAILDDDVRRCLCIGEHGAALLPAGQTVLTHCNAGALATAGYGTALGVIRSAWRRHGDLRVFVDETRPWLQGSRLTAWELSVEGIPYQVITDNMAGHFMARGEIQAVVVGADRIAANGDTANKIGTYSVAVLAREHRIPFYVAAPLSTVDLAIAGGDEIPIEERSEDEVLCVAGRRVCPPGARGRHPAFDVTPAARISGIVTEEGVLRPPYEESLRAAATAASGREAATGQTEGGMA